MVDIVDSDMEDQISQKLSRIGRSNPRLTQLVLPKRPDLTAWGSSKYYLQDVSRDSPTFSPLNSVENKNKKNIHYDQSGERNREDRGSLKPNGYGTLKQGKQEKAGKSLLGMEDLDYQRFRREAREELVTRVPKVEYPAYSQGGMFRRTRCTSYFTGKENNTSHLNYTSSGFKREVPPLDQSYKYSGSRISNAYNDQIAQTNKRNKQILKENEDLKNTIRQLKLQLKNSSQKQQEYQRVIGLICKESGENVLEMEGVTQFIKRCQRNQSLVNSIMDMKLKITGKAETNLKELWRWLKSSVQELGHKKDLTSWIKEDCLLMPREDPDQLIRMRLMEKLRR